MIQYISDKLYQRLDTRSLIKHLKKRESVQLRGFTGSSRYFPIPKLNAEFSSVTIVEPEFENAAAVASDLEQMGVENVYLFPPTRTKPYDDEKLQDISMLVQRSEVLEKIQNSGRCVIVTSSDAIVDKLISSSSFTEASITLLKGQEISPADLRKDLTDQGYNSVKFVDEPGDFAIRGGIFDVFPFSGSYPVRIEFFGDEIDSLREFDPDSQRSVAFLSETRLVPNATFGTNGPKESIFSYLPDNSLLFLKDPDLIQSNIENYFQKAEQIYSENKDSELPEPSGEFLVPGEWQSVLENYPKLVSGSFAAGSTADHVVTLDSSPHPSFNGSFKLLRSFISEKSSEGIQTIILCDNINQKERFDDLLGNSTGEFQYNTTLISLHEGFILNNELAVLTDHQIFNRYHRPKIRQKRVTGGISLKELKELNVGDFVVHVDYGIGTFAGFKKIKVRDIIQEAAILRYKDDSILYVNVSSLHKLQKYSGKEGKTPRITKLGSGEWARKKAKTRKKVQDIARELIQLYAKRKALEAWQFSEDNSWQTEMEARFEFEETPDQMNAIMKVKEDMESGNPMDRLVCGDVGFGKTEVAIRAAFKAVMDQKQVAVLVPTTILADQHQKTFTTRMKDFPVKIEALSRFRSPAEQKKIIEDLEAGKVDIVIGTHRLVSKDVTFKDLGLIVIDEEQRFGVKVKEKLKKFRATIDVLTMTATPIPRTMQFSLMGARDLSIINTPPANRQPVYTEIHTFDEELIRDAVIQELSRGGQVFFIHNRVKNIEEVANMIRQLVPDVRVRFAHGQMTGSKLEKIIRDFYQNKFDVLVSTNIVENGIDISNANTMIINNANHFGLSELHQLRGRVGRSNRKAFCYLLTQPVHQLSPEARKRLMALEEFSDLGSGFNIAMRDLDIRGAGDILGAEQSGFINEIGFELYTKILDDAVRELKETEFEGVFESEPSRIGYPDTQIEFDYEAYLDNNYVQDNVERLNLYRRLAGAQTEEEITDWQDEIKDRFGPLPESGKNLLLATKIKLFASRLLLTKVTIRADRMWLVCPKNNSKLSADFYDSGFFQKLLAEIELQRKDNYQVVQKNETVRIVIQDIPDPQTALEFLKHLDAVTKENESEVTA